MFPTKNFRWTCNKCRHTSTCHRDPNSVIYLRSCPVCGTEMEGHFIIKSGPMYPNPHRKD